MSKSQELEQKVGCVYEVRYRGFRFGRVQKVTGITHFPGSGKVEAKRVCDSASVGSD